MSSPRALLLLALLALVGACATLAAQPTPGPNAVHITILQLNDCYELLPAGGTDLGGVARVATLRKQLQAKNPNTYAFLAGDLFSPSALGTTPIPFPDGPAFDGEQMVAGMNAIGLDLACLGNHETDVKEAPFRSNLIKSNFTWLSANAHKPFANLDKNAVIETRPSAHPDGRTVKMGVVGLTIDSNNKDYQSYDNFTYSSSVVASQQIAELNDLGADIIVALTHWDAKMDRVLTENVAGISIVVGGHEHSVIVMEDTLAPIYKADSNVRTVFVHDIWVDTTKDRTDEAYFIHHPQLVEINSTLADDPEAVAIIQPYITAAYASYNASGFNPEATVALLTVDVDLRGSALGSGPLPASTWFAEAIYASASAQLDAMGMSEETGPVDIAFFNVGTLRIDDLLIRGTILSEYDVLRIAPFVNLVQVMRIRGDVLRQVLTVAQGNKYGRQGNTYASQFLAYTNMTFVEKVLPDNSSVYAFSINGVPLDDARQYKLAITDYLSGGPDPYSFLKEARARTDEFSVIFTASDRDADDPVRKMSDPRGFFITNLREMFPPSGPTPTPTPTPTGEASFVSFVLRAPMGEVNTVAFREDLVKDIAAALGVLQERVEIVAIRMDENDVVDSLEAVASITAAARIRRAQQGARFLQSGGRAGRRLLQQEGPRTRVIFSIAESTDASAISASQAAADFVAQSKDAESKLRKESTSFADLDPSSAAVVPDPHPPTPSSTGADGMGAASANLANLVHVAMLAIVAVVAAMRAI